MNFDYIICKNKKINNNYTKLEQFLCGIQLIGLDIKLIKLKNVSIDNSYIIFKNNEIFISGLLNFTNHRYAKVYNKLLHCRKLLINKFELKYINAKYVKRNIQVHPISLVSKKHLIKIIIAPIRKKNIQKQANVKYNNSIQTKMSRIIKRNMYRDKNDV